MIRSLRKSHPQVTVCDPGGRPGAAPDLQRQTYSLSGGRVGLDDLVSMVKFDDPNTSGRVKATGIRLMQIHRLGV